MLPTLNKQTQCYLEAFVVDSFAKVKGSKSIYIKNCKQKLIITIITDILSLQKLASGVGRRNGERVG